MSDDRRTARWQTGELITHKDAGITGFAKWTYSRKSDGKKFLRVLITSGKRAHFEDWENGNWIVGQGTHELTCRDCGFPFRSNHPEDLWCPPCERLQQPRQDRTAMSQGHHRALLRGNATREPGSRIADPVSVVRDHDDDFKSPF